jgi:hypothetical protein
MDDIKILDLIQEKRRLEKLLKNDRSLNRHQKEEIEDRLSDIRELLYAHRILDSLMFL